MNDVPVREDGCCRVADRSDDRARAWVAEAVRKVEADANRSADTHLHAFPLPDLLRDSGLDLYLKDESVHPTGSLKHRLARSLVLHALVNGWIHSGTTLVEASSGSTAVADSCSASPTANFTSPGVVSINAGVRLEGATLTETSSRAPRGSVTVRTAPKVLPEEGYRWDTTLPRPLEPSPKFQS